MLASALVFEFDNEWSLELVGPQLLNISQGDEIGDKDLELIFGGISYEENLLTVSIQNNKQTMFFETSAWIIKPT